VVWGWGAVYARAGRALDDVVYTTEVTDFDKVDQIKTPARAGVFIHGLFVEAAAWSRQEKCVGMRVRVRVLLRVSVFRCGNAVSSCTVLVPL
jgi:hypothetical protein